MKWFILFLAGFFEILWAVAMKYSQGFTKIVPSVFTAITMAASVYLLSVSVKTFPLGTAYAIWTGIGTIGAVVFGIVLFNESNDIIKMLCIFLIIAGIVGLRIHSGK